MRKPKFEYGDFITLKPNADVSLSYMQGSLPHKYLVDGGLWAVDGYEESSGMLNINRVWKPYPGAFCSWVHESDVELFSRARDRRYKK